MSKTYACPDDPTHQSTTPDFCSVCGAMLEAAAPPPSGTAGPAAVPRPAAGGDVCSNCGVTRRRDMLFCENCGLDFATGRLDIPDEPSTVLAITAPANTPAATATPTPAADAANPTVRMPHATLEAVVTVDLGARERPDEARPPDDRQSRVYLLDLDRLLIGRGSTSVKPQIVLKGDTGVSRGHAELIRQRDGSYAVRDLDSANGTMVNGQPLTDQQLKPVAAGDQIAIGFWYTLTIREH